MDKITFSQHIVMWLSGYYNGKRNNTDNPKQSRRVRKRSTSITGTTAKRLLWMPSRTRAWTNDKASILAQRVAFDEDR